MNDIEGRKDLELLMAEFYASLLQDSTISYIFTDVANIDLAAHLPHIVDFWEQNLFGTANYKRNVLLVHQNLNAIEKLNSQHFTTWLNHFDQTVDTNFAGHNAEKIKTRALSIATIMQLKL